jgi:hypothetical protein
MRAIIARVKSYEIESEHVFLAAGYGATGFLGAHEPYLMMCTYIMIAGCHTLRIICKRHKGEK